MNASKIAASSSEQTMSPSLHEIAIDTPRGRFAALSNAERASTAAFDVGVAEQHDPRPPLLALHGWLDNAASFLPMAPLLSRYRLVALDMPGHGRSFHYPDAGEYTSFTALLDILAAADALGWTRFAVLGHSMGGAIASLLAAAAPERIAALHLIEALGPLAAPEEGAATRLRDALAKRRALDPTRKRVFADIDSGVQARMNTNVTTLDEASARLIVGRGVREVDGGYLWSSDARLTTPTAIRLTEPQIRDCLRAIECPVRIVMADPHPPYIPPSMREARIACVRDIVSRVLPGSHHLHMTHPREVTELLELR
jgi:pimeloyl-ACP methyl ester carboxylesterase